MRRVDAKVSETTLEQEQIARLRARLLDGTLLDDDEEELEGAEGEDPSREDIATPRSPASARVGPHSEGMTNIVGVDKDNVKMLVDHANGILARVNKASERAAKATSEADREKMDEALFLEYEKLQHQFEDAEAQRKEMGVERFFGNMDNIAGALADNLKKSDDSNLGDTDTFVRVQQLLGKLFVRRPAGGSELDTADASKHIAVLKHKLEEAREQSGHLRMKVKELSSALKVASMECKSTQDVLADRNEEVDRMRTTINMQQLQLRNLKARVGMFSSAAAPATAGSREEVLRDLEQLRQEYQDLAEVNIHLEKENRMLRARNEFQPLNASYVPEKTPLIDYTALANKKQLAAELPTASAMISLMNQKRGWFARVEYMESCLMGAYDKDANAPRQLPNSYAVPGVSKGAKISAATFDVVDANGLAASLDAQSVPHAATPTNALAGKAVAPATGGAVKPLARVASKVNPADAAQAEEKTVRRSSLKESSGVATAGPAPDSASQSSSTPEVEAPKPPLAPPTQGWKDTSNVWMILRKKVLSNVALSRADVLRREEAHVKKMRHHISLLSSEMSAAIAERDALQEKLTRTQQELADTKESLLAANARADKVVDMLSTRRESYPTGVEETWRPADSVKDASPLPKPPEAKEGESNNTQAEALASIFNDKIQRLQLELTAKESQVNELLKMVAQGIDGNGATTGGTGGSASAVAEVIAPSIEPMALKRLEKEVMKKDQQLHERDSELKELTIRLTAAEDMLSEERAMSALGLSSKCATRVISVLRSRLRSARLAIQEKALKPRPLEERRKTLSDVVGSNQEEEDSNNDQTVGMSGGGVGRTIRGVRADDPTLRLGKIVEEEQDEEQTILQQMVTIARNPAIKDYLNKMLAQLELAETAFQPAAGGSIARKERDFYMMRRLWLRLLTVREAAWHEAATEDTRKILANRVVDTYEGLLKFEQMDSGELRPSFACAGALRVVSMAASPISQETGLRSLEEVEREYSALVELVKTRNAQMLQLESDRDELMSKIDRMSLHTRQNKKKACIPPSALVVRHKVAENETLAVVCAKYGITNIVMLRDIFGHAPRSVELRPMARVWIPIYTFAALEVAAESEKTIFVARLCVQPKETMKSIAFTFNVAEDKVVIAGTLDPAAPIVASGASAVSVLDVMIPKAAAAKILPRCVVPDMPTQQSELLLFAVVDVVGSFSSRMTSRIYGVNEEDMELYNEPLETGMFVDIPLILSRATLPLLNSLVLNGSLNVQHLVCADDTVDTIAQRYQTSSEIVTQASPGPLKPHDVIMIPLTTLNVVADLTQDAAIKDAILERPVRGSGTVPPNDSSYDARQVRSAVGTPDHASPTTASGEVAAAPTPGTATTAAAPATSVSIFTDPVPPLPMIRHTSDAAPIVRGRHGSITFTEDKDVERVASVRKRRRGKNDTDFNTLLEHRVEGSQTLVSVATKYKVLREDIDVPNFAFLDRLTSQWFVRLRTTEGLAIAREQGCDVYCVVPLEEESVRDLVAQLGLSIEIVLQKNEELQQLKQAIEDGQILSGNLRVPLPNFKVQTAVLRRSGEMYAVVSPGSNGTVASVAETFGVACDDIGAFDVNLDATITPAAFIRPRKSLVEGAEHRVMFSFVLQDAGYHKLRPEQQFRLCAAIEMDVLGIAQYAQTIGMHGEILYVQVRNVFDDDRAVVCVACTTYDLAQATSAMMVEDAATSHMENTQKFLVTLNPATPSIITLTPEGLQLQSFLVGVNECIVVAVQEDDILAKLALFYGIGTQALFDYNTDLGHIAAKGHPQDGSPEALRGVAELRIPGQGRPITVGATESLLDVVVKTGVAAEKIRMENIEVLPLSLYVKTLRIPVSGRSVKVPPTIIIQATTGESVLSLATRYGVGVDRIRVNKLDMYAGTDLHIPEKAGKTTAGKTFQASAPRLKRVEHGETLRSVAAECDCLESELILENASLIRVVPGAAVSIPQVSAERKSASGKGDDAAAHNGLFIRHVVQPGESLVHISSVYYQPITTVLAANPTLLEKSGAHAIFIPVQHQERDEMLAAVHGARLYTIVSPGSYDTPASLARKFKIPFESVRDATALLNDNKHVVIPIASSIASSIVRQKDLEIFIGTELRLGETLVALADRFGVFVKDLMILGRPLYSLNVSEVDIPVSYDVARGLLIKPAHASDRVLLRTTMADEENLSALLEATKLSPEDVKKTTVGAVSTAQIAIPSLDVLDRLRKREAERQVLRSELIDRTMQIAHALRQLNERHEATQRELDKVDLIRKRALEGSLTLPSGLISGNVDSVGVQTDDVEIASGPKVAAHRNSIASNAQRRNGTTQTKLIGQQLEETEEALKVRKGAVGGK